VGAGAWTLTGSNYFTGTTTVNAGKLIINGDHHAATGAVLVNAAGTLAGTGRIGGVTTVNGILAPGPLLGLGPLSFSNNLTLGSTSSLQMGISKSPKTNDALFVAGTMALNGSLTVSNLAGTLALGDTFKLFSATAVSGNFSSVSLPPLTNGLSWNKIALASSGTITVVSNTQPVLGKIVVNGSALKLSGSNGVPGNLYFVITATNVAMPVAQWTPVLTNSFDMLGNFICTNPLSISTPQKYYRLLVPGN